MLVTRFLAEQGVGQITDFMPVVKKDEPGFEWLVRRVTVSRGTMRFRAVCRPAFDYARSPHRVERTEGGALFHRRPWPSSFHPAPLQVHDGAVLSEFSLQEGESGQLRAASGGRRRRGAERVTDGEAEALFESTVEFWRRWLSACTYTDAGGRWCTLGAGPEAADVRADRRDRRCADVQPARGRSAAAATGTTATRGSATPPSRSTRSMRIGFVEEAGRFMSWLDERCRELRPDGTLQLVYRIDGRPVLTEEILDHLDGYRGSRPVRVGNGASRQLQLDIYGELMDSVYLYNKYGTPHLLRPLAAPAPAARTGCATTGSGTDDGIWEVRGGRQHFVYSKLMCWVAVDRSRCASPPSAPSPPTGSAGSRCGTAIYADIMKNGWSEERQAFVQSYGSDSLDASTLMMPLVFFVSPTDPRMVSTIEAINRSPAHGRPRLQQPRVPLRRRADAGRDSRRRGDVQHLHLLAG